MSNNSLQTIEYLLKKHNLYDLFSFVRTEKSLFGNTRHLKKILKHYQLKPEQTFYVGDEGKDIEAANANKINSIASTWGLHSPKLLSSAKPDFLIERPSDL